MARIPYAGYLLDQDPDEEYEGRSRFDPLTPEQRAASGRPMMSLAESTQAPQLPDIEDVPAPPGVGAAGVQQYLQQFVPANEEERAMYGAGSPPPRAEGELSPMYDEQGGMSARRLTPVEMASMPRGFREMAEVPERPEYPAEAPGQMAARPEYPEQAPPPELTYAETTPPMALTSRQPRGGGDVHSYGAPAGRPGGGSVGRDGSLGNLAAVAPLALLGLMGGRTGGAIASGALSGMAQVDQQRRKDAQRQQEMAQRGRMTDYQQAQVGMQNRRLALDREKMMAAAGRGMSLRDRIAMERLGLEQKRFERGGEAEVRPEDELTAGQARFQKSEREAARRARWAGQPRREKPLTASQELARERFEYKKKQDLKAAAKKGTVGKGQSQLESFEQANQALYITTPDRYLDIINKRGSARAEGEINTVNRALHASEKLMNLDREYAEIPVTQRLTQDALRIQHTYDKLKKEHQGIMLKIAGMGVGDKESRQEIVREMPNIGTTPSHFSQPHLQSIHDMLVINAVANLENYGIGIREAAEHEGRPTPPRGRTDFGKFSNPTPVAADDLDELAGAEMSPDELDELEGLL